MQKTVLFLVALNEETEVGEYQNFAARISDFVDLARLHGNADAGFQAMVNAIDGDRSPSSFYKKTSAMLSWAWAAAT